MSFPAAFHCKVVPFWVGFSSPFIFSIFNNSDISFSNSKPSVFFKCSLTIVLYEFPSEFSFVYTVSSLVYANTGAELIAPMANTSDDAITFEIILLFLLNFSS